MLLLVKRINFGFERLNALIVGLLGSLEALLGLDQLAKSSCLSCMVKLNSRRRFSA